MSGTSTEVSLYLLLPGRGNKGQGGPGKTNTIKANSGFMSNI